MKDKRYSITLEFCGFSTAKHVVRFCGDMIGAYDSRDEEKQVSLDHKADRDFVLTGGFNV